MNKHKSAGGTDVSFIFYNLFEFLYRWRVSIEWLIGFDIYLLARYAGIA